MLRPPFPATVWRVVGLAYHKQKSALGTTVLWGIAGPGGRPDNEMFNGMTIMDTAPTALHAIDVPVPGGMQGRVIFEAFQ